MSHFKDMDVGPFSTELVQLYKETDAEIQLRGGVFDKAMARRERRHEWLRGLWRRVFRGRYADHVLTESARREQLRESQDKLGYLEKIGHLTANYGPNYSWNAHIVTRNQAGENDKTIDLEWSGYNLQPTSGHVTERFYLATLNKDYILTRTASEMIGQKYGWIVDEVLARKTANWGISKSQTFVSYRDGQLNDAAFQKVLTPNF